MAKDGMTREEIIGILAGDVGYAAAEVVDDHDATAFAIFRRQASIIDQVATAKDAQLVLKQIVGGFQENGGDFFFLPEVFGTCKKTGVLQKFCPNLVFISLAEPNTEEGFRFPQHRQKLVGRDENGKIVVKAALDIAYEMRSRKPSR